MAQVSVYSVTEAMHVLPESFDINHCGGVPHSKEQMFTELLSVVKQLPVYKTYRNLWRLYNNTFDVEKIVIHEEYNSNEMKIHSHDADLALIKVAEHLPLHKADFATLPDNNTPSPAQEDRCLALGLDKSPSIESFRCSLSGQK
nr:hypothetical protein BaRGS_010846 [Batillaria attramentaria]